MTHHKRLLDTIKIQQHEIAGSRDSITPTRREGKDSGDCTLVLCEGLSAKTYAVIGIGIGWNKKKGRDYFGVFALRGKLLNVRNATTDSISGNKEIASVIQGRLGIITKDQESQVCISDPPDRSGVDLM